MKIGEHTYSATEKGAIFHNEVAVLTQVLCGVTFFMGRKDIEFKRDGIKLDDVI